MNRFRQAILVLLALPSLKLAAQGYSRSAAPVVAIKSVQAARESRGHCLPFLIFPLPRYPLEMSRAGIAGEVDVRLTVGTDGLVKKVTIIKSSQREFEPSVASAVRAWKFLPIADPMTKQKEESTVDCHFEFGFGED